MKEPIYTLSPSVIYKLITLGSKLNDETDAILTFAKLKEYREITDETIDNIIDADISAYNLPDDLPQKLRPLAEALYGLVSVEDPDSDL